MGSGVRVLVLNSELWRDMGLARALESAQEIKPILERDLGDQTLSKSLASVVLVSEGTVRTDARRSVPAIRTMPSATSRSRSRRASPGRTPPC